MTDKLAEGLEPCPWCESIVVHAALDTHMGRVLVYCLACGARGPATPTEAGAIAAWNRRPAVAALMGDGDQFLLTSINNLNEKRATLFEAIKHGDAEHQRWLNTAILDHFSGHTVQRPLATPPSDPVEGRVVIEAMVAQPYGYYYHDKAVAGYYVSHMLELPAPARAALIRLLGGGK